MGIGQYRQPIPAIPEHARGSRCQRSLTCSAIASQILRVIRQSIAGPVQSPLRRLDHSARTTPPTYPPAIARSRSLPVSPSLKRSLLHEQEYGPFHEPVSHLVPLALFAAVRWLKFLLNSGAPNPQDLRDLLRRRSKLNDQPTQREEQGTLRQGCQRHSAISPNRRMRKSGFGLLIQPWPDEQATQ